MKTTDESNPERLRVIQTARTKKAINQGVEAGFRPLVKPVEASPDIHSKFCVWQHCETGKIQVVSDYMRGDFNDAWKQVIDWTDYYPHSFPEPFAAYLIPPDIQPGECVWVKDLIEDFIRLIGNCGDHYRLESWEAVWDGKDLVIQYAPSKHLFYMVG